MKFTVAVLDDLNGQSPHQTYIVRAKDRWTAKKGRWYSSLATELGDAVVIEWRFPLKWEKSWWPKSQAGQPLPPLPV